MAIEYSRRYLKTRWHVTLQNVALLLLLTPLLTWRFLHARPLESLAVGMLALAPFVTSFRALRFLARQERQLGHPTPEMNFLFEQARVVPLAMTGFLLALLSQV